MSLAVLQADCKRAVQSLANLTSEQLDEIINNDEKLDNILLSVDQSFLKEIEAEKEKLMKLNQEMGEATLSREPELIESREKLAKLNEEAEIVTKSVEEKTKELKEKNGDLSLETALALLQTAASEIEEESEQIAKRFLGNELDLEEFLDKFLVLRKLMHVRLVKAEKMAKIVTRDPTAGTRNYANSPPLSINSSYFPGVPPIANSVPYPTGPLNMPMPGMNYFQNHY